MVTRRRVLLSAVTTVLLLPLLAVGAGSPSSAAKVAVPLSPEARAAASGEPVEVVAERSETDTVMANPDGTYVREVSAVPVREHAADGWEDIDLTLVERADGSVGPKVAPGGIALSGGGDDDLSALSLGTTRTRTKWLDELPVPTLDGPTATYPQVFPGVDLRMTVTDAGISQVLVVKDAKAADNPALRDLTLPTTVEGGDLEGTDGGIAVNDEFGREVGTAAAPLMWDSSGAVAEGSTAQPSDTSDAAIDARTTGPAAGDKIVGVPLAVDDDQITLSPTDQALDSPTVDYPLFIDPSTTPSKTAWSMVFKENSSSEFYKWTDSGGQGVGYQNYNGVSTKRLFWKFGTSAVSGSKIAGAYFKTQVLYGASCDSTDVKAYRTGSISSSTNWGNQPSWSDYLDTVKVDPCPAGKEPEWLVKDAAQYAADHNSSSLTLGLRASSETNPRAWKRFSYKATLVINYSKYPDTATNLLVNGKPCTSPVVLGRLTTPPTLSATMKDPDGGTLNGYFDVANATSIVTDPKNYTVLSTGPLNSGSRHNTEPSKFPVSADGWEDGHIKSGQWVFRTKARDTTSLALYAKAHATCRFSIDANLPSPPVVSAPSVWDYNVPTDVSVTPAGDVSDTTGYVYSVNNPAKPAASTKTAAQPDGTAVITPKATVAGPNTLRVWAVDAAGNISDTAAENEFEAAGLDATNRSLYDFNDEYGHDTAKDRSRSFDLTLAAKPTQAVGEPRWAKLGSYTSSSGTVIHDDALAFDPTVGYAAAAGQLLQTGDSSFVISAWLKPSVADGAPGTARTAVAYGGPARSAAKLGIVPADDFAESGEYVYAFSAWDSAAGAYRQVTTPEHVVMDDDPQLVIGWYESSTRTLRVLKMGTATTEAPSAGDVGLSGYTAPTSAPTDRATLGAATTGSAASENWSGWVDHVTIAQGSLGDEQLARLYKEKRGIIYCDTTECH